MTHTDYPKPVKMRRSYKFLLRPTAQQAIALSACLEDHRQLYNAALEERRQAWRIRRVPMTYYSQARQLPVIRAADRDGQGRWSAGSQQQTLRRLDKAFAAFFRRVKAGGNPGYPRFKGRGWFNSVDWPALKNGARWDLVPHSSVTRVYLLGVGHVRVHRHRPIAGTVKTVSVKREGHRWYLIVSCDEVPAEPLPVCGAVIGIDMGIASFLTTSDGEHLRNARPLAATAERLANAQRSLTSTKQGSNRRRKAAARVTGLHAKVCRTRRDHAHKVALALVRDHDVIVHEALKTGNMTRRPKPRPLPDGTYEPNGAAAKAGLNRSILDAGWGVFLRILAAKAESAGRTIIAVDPRHTSQRCTRCGHVAAGNRVTQAEFRCLACAYQAHADVNAAQNILRAGLARQVAQAA